MAMNQLEHVKAVAKTAESDAIHATHIEDIEPPVARNHWLTMNFVCLNDDDYLFSLSVEKLQKS